MAISTTTLDQRYLNKIIQDTDIDETPLVAITGASSGKVHFIFVQAGGTNETNYFKIFDTGEIDLGNTPPIFQFPVAASTTVECIMSEGLSYSNALSAAAQTAPGTSGAGGPSGATITLRMVAS